MNVNGQLRRFTSLVLFFLGVTGGLSAQDQTDLVAFLQTL